ncbi:MAG: VOC family protein [Flavobacteriaceae bacterium]|nr:VOC family protein [Flavobacteriaceae bacterium]
MQIQELIIYSPNIKAQADFYSNLLGLSIIKEDSNSISIQIGTSLLKIEYKAETTPYHFAINIPANKEVEALDWLKSKVTILKDEANEIQDFESWNSKAMYFYDEDKNIVELIARKNLQNNSVEIFDSNFFLNISEIGLPTFDIEKEFNILHKQSGIEIYDGGFERFCAIGDENGLFICIDKKQKDWFPTNDKAYSSDFEVQFKEKGKEYSIQYKNNELKSIQYNLN